METINVEKIMQEIREDIKSKGYTNDMLSFCDVQIQDTTYREYNKSEFESALHNMGVHAYVPWYRDLSHSAVKRFIQKVIRKFCAFLIAPVTEQQSNFNSESVRAFGQVVGYIEQSENQMESYQKTIELLEEKVEKLEAELKILGEKKG